MNSPSLLSSFVLDIQEFDPSKHESSLARALLSTIQSLYKWYIKRLHEYRRANGQMTRY